VKASLFNHLKGWWIGGLIGLRLGIDQPAVGNRTPSYSFVALATRLRVGPGGIPGYRRALLLGFRPFINAALREGR